MGVDAAIYFKSLAEQPEFDAPVVWAVRKINRDYEEAPVGATHALECFCRFYDLHHDRGPWPKLCSALMQLMREPLVGEVWYCGDSYDAREQKPITVDEILEISRHYMESRP